MTGRGADLIVIDDPLNANEAQSEAARKRVIDWYGGSLVSRLNDKRTGTIVAVMQRLHEDDLAGHLLRQGGWEHLDLPAIAVEEQTIQLGPGKPICVASATYCIRNARAWRHSKRSARSSAA